MLLNFTYMHSNVTIKNVSWLHFNWATLLVGLQLFHAQRTLGYQILHFKDHISAVTLDNVTFSHRLYA